MVLQLLLMAMLACAGVAAVGAQPATTTYTGFAAEYRLFFAPPPQAGGDQRWPFFFAIAHCRDTYGAGAVGADMINANGAGSPDEPQAFTALCKNQGINCWNNAPLSSSGQCAYITAGGANAFASCSTELPFVCRRPLATSAPPYTTYVGARDYRLFGDASTAGSGQPLPFFFAIAYCRDSWGDATMISANGSPDEPQAFSALCQGRGRACWSNQAMNAAGQCAYYTAAGALAYASCSAELPFVCKRPLTTSGPTPSPSPSPSSGSGPLTLVYNGLAEYRLFTASAPSGQQLPFFFAIAYCRDAFGGGMIGANGAGDEPQAFSALCQGQGQPCWSNQAMNAAGQCAHYTAGGALAYASCSAELPFVCKRPLPAASRLSPSPAPSRGSGSITVYNGMAEYRLFTASAPSGQLPFFFAIAYCRDAFGGAMITANGVGTADEPQAFSALCNGQGRACWSNQAMNSAGQCAYIASPGGALAYASCSAAFDFVCKRQLSSGSAPAPSPTPSPLPSPSPAPSAGGGLVTSYVSLTELVLRQGPGQQLPYFFAIAWCRDTYGGSMIQDNGVPTTEQFIGFRALCTSNGKDCWSNQPMGPQGACAYITAGRALQYADCNAASFDFVCRRAVRPLPSPLPATGYFGGATTSYRVVTEFQLFASAAQQLPFFFAIAYCRDTYGGSMSRENGLTTAVEVQALRALATSQGLAVWSNEPLSADGQCAYQTAGGQRAYTSCSALFPFICMRPLASSLQG